MNFQTHSPGSARCSHTLSPSAVKPSQTSLTGREIKRGTREGKPAREMGLRNATETSTPPASRFTACTRVCVVNEFGELSPLYDSCNWPGDSCYYTLQQGDTVCEEVEKDTEKHYGHASGMLCVLA